MAKNNDIFLVGRVGKDSVIKGKITKFDIAVWKGKDKPAMWVPIIYFGDSMFYKGDEVEVNGRLDDNPYDGKKYWQVVADTVTVRHKDNDKDFPTEDDDIPL